MKKPANKPIGKVRRKDEFTVTEVGSLIDKLRSEFKVFGEDLISVKEDVSSTKEMVADSAERISLLEAAVKGMAAEIKTLTNSIDKLVRTKADREEFLTLEKRVGNLEAKVASLA